MLNSVVLAKRTESSQVCSHGIRVRLRSRVIYTLREGFGLSSGRLFLGGEIRLFECFQFSRYCSSLSNSTLSESEARLLFLSLRKTFRDLIQDSISNRLRKTTVEGDVLLNLLVEFCLHII